MKVAIAKPICSITAVFLFSGHTILAQPHATLRLNKDAVASAAQLINEGRVIADTKDAWKEDRSSMDQENEFIRMNGFVEYAKWHLRIDERYPANTKRRYKFPYGDFKNVHRCGLLAARSRAAQFKYSEIENAAARLIQMIGRKKDKVDSALIERRYGLAVPSRQESVNEFR